MLTVSRPVIHEFAAKAREACGDEIEEIILFGSVARGDDRPDSDIDILVITSREDYRLREYLTGLAFDLLMLIRERLSVKVLSRADIVAHQKYPFIRNTSSRRRGGIGDRIGLL
jgi:predicted nucleotidyltransferase